MRFFILLTFYVLPLDIPHLDDILRLTDILVTCWYPHCTWHESCWHSKSCYQSTYCWHSRSCWHRRFYILLMFYILLTFSIHMISWILLTFTKLLEKLASRRHSPSCWQTESLDADMLHSISLLINSILNLLTFSVWLSSPGALLLGHRLCIFPPVHH